MGAERIRRVPWSIRDSLVLFLVPWVLLPVVIGLVLAQLAVFFPQLEPVIAMVEEGGVTAAFIILALDALVSLLLVSYYLKKYGAKWRETGLRPFSVLKALLAVIVALYVLNVAISVLFDLLQSLFDNFKPDQEQVTQFEGADSPLLRALSIVALVVVTPFIEEVVFRGFIFPAFAKRSGLIMGAVASSILFGLAHLQLNVGIYTGFLGLILCYMYVKFDSIWPGIVLHAANNYIAYMVLIR